MHPASKSELTSPFEAPWPKDGCSLENRSRTEKKKRDEEKTKEEKNTEGVSVCCAGESGGWRVGCVCGGVGVVGAPMNFRGGLAG